jgi:uncharacterized membrane protein
LEASEDREAGMHWNDGGWWWWIPMTVTMIVFWTLVIWAIVRLAGVPWDRRAGGGRRTSIEILDERLARGEIGLSEYREVREEIERSSGPG